MVDAEIENVGSFDASQADRKSISHAISAFGFRHNARFSVHVLVSVWRLFVVLSLTFNPWVSIFRLEITREDFPEPKPNLRRQSVSEGDFVL